MYKIHFQQNKDTIIGAGILLLIVIVAIVNAVGIGTVLWDVYRSDGSQTSDKTIDEVTVNEAINIVNQNQ